jgi:hypothetical protein
MQYTDFTALNKFTINNKQQFVTLRCVCYKFRPLDCHFQIGKKMQIFNSICP